jgi:Family of unknown function (DUF5683)
MLLRVLFCIFFLWCGIVLKLHAQDVNRKPPLVAPTATVAKKIIDTSNKHSPKIALRRSALLPGWGQVYNKQIWKIPIIYGALGVTAYIFFDNVKWYNRTRYAFNVRASATATPAEIADINPRLKDLTKEDLSFYRKQFRRDVDYSVLFFLGFWGLNMADAVVFAHLKDFDVSDKISGSIKLGNSTIAQTTGLNLNKKKSGKLFVVR